MNIKGIIVGTKEIYRTFRVEDISIISVTTMVTVIGKLCTGLIPIIALIVAIYQLRLQRARLKAERFKLEEAECHSKEISQEGQI